MRKKKFWNRIPYPVRAAICGACILFLLYVLYISLGYPTLTLKQEFRRAEKAHFVGPSTIVEITEDWEFDKMIVGETDHGVCFFAPHEMGIIGSNRTFTTYYFSYREKTGDLTVFGAPSVFYHFWDSFSGEEKLPLYIFADVPNADRVQVELQVTRIKEPSVDGSKVIYEYDEYFLVDGQPIADGVFKCNLTGVTADEKAALEQVCEMSMGARAGSAFEDAVIPITVRFYDGNGQLIAEKQTELRTTDNQ